jgi:hypothetical protein
MHLFLSYWIQFRLDTNLTRIDTLHRPDKPSTLGWDHHLRLVKLVLSVRWNDFVVFYWVL